MFLISRKEFDYYLLQRALKNKSVTFFDEKVTQVTRMKNSWILKTTKNKEVNVKVLIGADGCSSLVRKYIFRPIPSQFLASTVGYNFRCSSKYMETAFAKNTVEAYYSHEYVQKMGFIWIFPKKTSINVGIGSLEAEKKLKQKLDKFILLNPFGKRLRFLPGDLFAHQLPIIWMKDFFDLPCSGENWALIGDAAGHVQPLGGAGIYYAMKGGMLCGLAFLDGDLQLFEKYWRQNYGDELYYGAETASRFYSNLGLFLWLRYIFENFLSQLQLLKESKNKEK
jgi:digeranylgeranylglycerophospholipid reductase